MEYKLKESTLKQQNMEKEDRKRTLYDSEVNSAVCQRS
jgi:hypothetical protein